MNYTDSQIISALRKAASEIFEGMAFTEVSDFQEIQFPFQVPTNSYSASIDLLNPIKGVFHFICSRDCSINVLGSSFEGPEPVNSTLVLADLISEYTNAIAGSFLRHLIPPNQTFEIRLPQFGTIQDNNNPLPEGERKMGITFRVENYPVFFLLSL